MPNSAASDIDRGVKIIDGERNAESSIERVSDLRELPRGSHGSSGRAQLVSPYLIAM